VSAVRPAGGGIVVCTPALTCKRAQGRPALVGSVAIDSWPSPTSDYPRVAAHQDASKAACKAKLYVALKIIRHALKYGNFCSFFATGH
jgi:hypothetical protein